MILIVDNYDSFTFNLYQLFAARAPAGQTLRVVRNDAITPDELASMNPEFVVLSPGPGHPRSAGISLVASNVLPSTPLLGVCLGHQALAVGLGGHVGRSNRPTHGRSVAIQHCGEGLLAGLPEPFDAALYHSLVVDEASLPSELTVVGRSLQGDVMALCHRLRPHHGVQFHPESFMTSVGWRLADNFLGTPCHTASPTD